MKTGSVVSLACVSLFSNACGSGGGGPTTGGSDEPNLVRDGSPPPDADDLALQEPRAVTVFEEVAERVGLTGIQGKGNEPRCSNPFLGSGAAWGDIDLDADLDLFATNHGGPNFLYRNEGDLDRDRLPDFIEVAGAFGIQESRKFSHASVFVDYDNDGDQDLYVTHLDTGNTLWKNGLMENGTLGFSDVTAFAGVADEGRAITAAWGDLDRDGFLDLYLAKHAECFTQLNPMPGDRLYHALGDGRFENWTRFLCANGSQDCRAVTGLGFAAAFLDSDNDGDADIYLVNDSTRGGGGNRHWRNDGPDGAGGWLLREVSVQLGTDTKINGMGLGVGDLDNDGWLDLAFSNIDESHVLNNYGDGSYTDITYSCGVYDATRLLTGWGTAFLDADNDGWLDLYFANGPIWTTFPTPDTLLHNNHDRSFTDVSRSAGVAGQRRGRSLSQADFDRDGFVDLFVGNLFDQPYLYRNRAGERPRPQHWLVVTVQGTVSNRDGIGTRLELAAGRTKMMREITSGSSHGGGDERAAFFGLGNATSGQLSVRWPTGVLQNHGSVRANQRLHLIEPD